MAATVVPTFEEDLSPWMLPPVEVGLGVSDGGFEPVKIGNLELVKIDDGNLEVDPKDAGTEIEEVPDISG